MRSNDVRYAREVRRREGYREVILHAAQRVVLRKGFSALTMDDVALEAQLSKATVYKYVAGKGPLLFEILGHSFDDISARFAEIAEGPGSASAKLGQLVTAVLESSEEAQQLNRVLLMDKAMLKLMRVFAPSIGRPGAVSPGDRKMLTLLRHKHQRMVTLAAGVLDEGVAAGEFRRLDTGQAAAFIEALLQGLTHMRFLASDGPLAPGSAQDLSRFILEGIRNPEHAAKEI